MPSDKRQRKKENAAARREAELAAQRQALMRRRMITIGIVAVVFVGIVFLVTRGGGKSESKDKTANGSSTTAKTGASTTAAPSTTQAEAVEPTCPKADGSSAKQGRFKAPFPANCTDPSKTYTATMETDVGTITIALDPKKAPKTVNNFVSLARYHYFDGIVFHRVIPDFVVQGGDPTGTGTGGPGYEFGDELPKPGDYKAGSLAMANSGPNTNGSQFFIVTSDNGAKTLVDAVGGKANYTLFGQVTGGMDVVKKIEADGTQEGTPKVLHKMVKVTIEEK